MSGTILGHDLLVAVSAVGVLGGDPDPEVSISPERAKKMLGSYFDGINPQDPEEVYYQMLKSGIREVLAGSKRLCTSSWGIATVVKKYVEPFADSSKTVDAFLRLFHDIAAGKLPVTDLCGA